MIISAALNLASTVVVPSAVHAEDLEATAALAGHSPLLEPSTLVILGLSLVALAVFRARFRTAK